MEKIFKARKDHTCDLCLRSIASGERYILVSNKGPRYDESDKQIGIDFYRYKSHLNYKGDVPCHAPESCRKGDHQEYFYESGYFGDRLSGSDEGYYCTDCGRFLTIDEYKDHV